MSSTRWRLNITANNGHTIYLKIAEVEMRATTGGADQCSGGTATASSAYTGYGPDLAFDDNDATSWVTEAYTVTGWIEYEFAGAVEVGEYTITPYQTDRAPKDWTLEYWNGSSWTVADTQSGETSWTTGVANTYSISDTVPIIESACSITPPRCFSILNPESIVCVVYAPVDNLIVSIPTIECACSITSPRCFSILNPESIACVVYVPRAVVINNPEPLACLAVAPAAKWALPATTPSREIYIAILRADGFTDIEVPMSSLQLRRRDGNPTMVSIVVPDAMTYFDYADDRDGGEIIIYAGSVTEDGTRHVSEFERATLETITYDVGVESSSLSLSGYRTETNINPRPVDLDGITYYGLQADGKRRIRGKVNIFLRPGDTAIWGEESFVVDQIYVKVEAANSWMEAAGA